jgi:UDP-3-O-[3-hydroxymyristoyl] glucosamine N-acyltransferase
MEVTLGELAVRFGCELRGDPSARVDSVGALSHAGARAITFLANPKYVAQLKETRAGAVILDAQSALQAPVAALVAANPHATYARVATLLHPDPPLHPGIHPQASVAPGAQVDASAEIAAQAFVGEGARIGARCYVGPGCVVERGAILGDDTRLVARVVIGHHVSLGARCIVQPGAVIGGDGFGFAPEKGTWVKIPQIGSVLVGDDVEIGSNTTIDRGALGDTVIEEGVKIDNLIMIAHNCRIGAHSALAACVAIAGSSVLGKRCILGGKVGLTGHITLHDDVVVLGTSFISHSITRPGVYSSALPSEEAGVWRRIVGRIKRLDAMAKRLRAVEKHVGFSAMDQDSSED